MVQFVSLPMSAVQLKQKHQRLQALQGGCKHRHSTGVQGSSESHKFHLSTYPKSGVRWSSTERFKYTVEQSIKLSKAEKHRIASTE